MGQGVEICLVTLWIRCGSVFLGLGHGLLYVLNRKHGLYQPDQQIPQLPDAIGDETYLHVFTTPDGSPESLFQEAN